MSKLKAQNKFKIQISKRKNCFVIWYLSFMLILNFVLCHLNFFKKGQAE